MDTLLVQEQEQRRSYAVGLLTKLSGVKELAIVTF
jgi:hypothetical protein